jgi:hypothetical protein
MTAYRSHEDVLVGVDGSRSIHIAGNGQQATIDRFGDVSDTPFPDRTRSMTADVRYYSTDEFVRRNSAWIAVAACRCFWLESVADSLNPTIHNT